MQTYETVLLGTGLALLLAPGMITYIEVARHIQKSRKNGLTYPEIRASLVAMEKQYMSIEAWPGYRLARKVYQV